MTMLICPECGNEHSERQSLCLRCNDRIAARIAMATAKLATPSIVRLRAARPSAWLGAALLMGIVGQLLCSFANHAAQIRLREQAARAHDAAALLATRPTPANP